MNHPLLAPLAEVYDLAVVGGGINGAGIAADAAAHYGQVVDFRERCKKRMIHGRL